MSSTEPKWKKDQCILSRETAIAVCPKSLKHWIILDSLHEDLCLTKKDGFIETWNYGKDVLLLEKNLIDDMRVIVLDNFYYLSSRLARQGCREAGTCQVIEPS